MRNPNCEYDIFSGTENNNPMWLGCVTGYEAARTRVQALSVEKPDRYFVFCTRTNRVVYAITATQIGLTLKNNNVNIDDAYEGHVSTAAIPVPRESQQNH